jgi:hypothetical protein
MRVVPIIAMMFLGIAAAQGQPKKFRRVCLWIFLHDFAGAKEITSLNALASQPPAGVGRRSGAR